MSAIADDKGTNQREAVVQQAARRLQQKGARGLRRTPPTMRRPEAETRQYRARIRDYTRKLHSEIADRLYPILNELVEEAGFRNDEARLDAWFDRLDQTIEATFQDMQPEVDSLLSTVPAIADQVMKRSDKEFKRSVRAVLGVEPALFDPRIDDLHDDWIREQGIQMRGMNRDQQGRLRRIVREGVRRGQGSGQIKKQLADANRDLTKHRSELIARTEVGQLYSQTAKIRHEDLGVDGYIWRTMRDERVTGRPGGLYPEAEPSHWAREGKRYTWNNPPRGGHPGERPNCRCRAAPDVRQLREEAEQEADE